MPRKVAAEIAAQLTAALSQLAKEGVKTERPRIPERVLRYSAEPMRMDDGEQLVALLLEGDRADEAGLLLDQARETFDRLGARPWLERTEKAAAPRVPA